MQDETKAGSGLSGGLSALGWPVGVPFTFYDSPGEHDPCFVVMPGGCSLPLNHCGTAEMDIARAKFIINACNAALEKVGADESLIWDLFSIFEDKSLLAGLAYQGAPLKSQLKNTGERHEGWNEATKTYRKRLNDLLLRRGLITEPHGPDA